MIGNTKKFLIKGRITISRSINLYTVESNIAKDLGKIQKRFSKNIDIGSYPFFRLGKIGVSVVLRSTNKSKLMLCVSDIKKMVKKKNINIFKN